MRSLNYEDAKLACHGAKSSRKFLITTCLLSYLCVVFNQIQTYSSHNRASGTLASPGLQFMAGSSDFTARQVPKPESYAWRQELCPLHSNVYANKLSAQVWPRVWTMITPWWQHQSCETLAWVMWLVVIHRYYGYPAWLTVILFSDTAIHSKWLKFTHSVIV